MIWLGLVFSVFSVLVPMGVLSVGRSVITYRLTGRERTRALRGSLLLLGASAIWSGLGLVQWVMWALPRGALLDLDTVGIGFHVLPVLLGWLPAAAFAIVSWPQQEVVDEAPPGWVRWLDGLWMG